MRRPGFVLLFVLGAVGCTHSVHQVGVATAEDVPPVARVRKIESEAEQSVVLGITDNTDFVDQAYAELLAQCPKGRVVGVETRHSTSHNFLHYRNRFKLTGLCLSEPADAMETSSRVKQKGEANTNRRAIEPEPGAAVQPTEEQPIESTSNEADGSPAQAWESEGDAAATAEEDGEP